MSDEPKCPKCKHWRCVVWKKNPHGGYMLHCNNCKEDWITKEMKHAKNS